MYIILTNVDDREREREINLSPQDDLSTHSRCFFKGVDTFILTL